MNSAVTQVELIPLARPEAREAVVALDLIVGDEVAQPTAGFVQSVKRWGVLEPIIVSKDASFRYLLIDGRRRTKAARLAGLDAVPARVYDVDGLAPDVMLLTLNEQRRSNPLLEYEAVTRLIEAGADEKAIQQATGYSIAKIRRLMRLFFCLDVVFLDALRAGKLSMTVARQASKLSANAQERLANKLEDVGKLKVADVEEEARVRTQTAAALLPDDLFVVGGPIQARPWQQRVAELLREAVSLIPEGGDEYVDDALAELLSKLEPLEVK